MSRTALPEQLAEGYSRFVNHRAPAEQALYQQLGQGQSPHTLVLSCADSRVDPATIFGAAPGELFVLRNVANLVPSFDRYSDDSHEGSEVGGQGPLTATAAGLEFAVGHLRVSRILVMGHARCGGVAAALHQCQHPEIAHDKTSGRYFIDRWVGQMADDGREVLADHPGADADTLQQQLEFRNVRQSVERLRSYPFIASAEAEGRLSLHGGWFSIADAALWWMLDDGSFAAVEA